MTSPADRPPALAPAIKREPVSYLERLAEREPTSVRLLVVHCTELPDLALARTYAERIVHPSSRTGNCGHYYIDRDGAIREYVPVSRVAHHVTDHNARTLGIELVNRGRYPTWYARDGQRFTEPYPDRQLAALARLARWLAGTLPALEAITGHEHLDRRQVPASDDPAACVRRKLDPGPLFPWDRFVTAIGLPLITEPEALRALGRDPVASGTGA